MPKPIKISVIVPIYNGEKYIEKCLEHLVHQTYKNIEIILIDDGSTDNSVQVCEKYATLDKRIRIKKQTNGGPSVALNSGLAMARGDYVHFHDHDDFANLDFFEKFAMAAEITDADILCGEANQPGYNFPEFEKIEILKSLAEKILKTRANVYHPAWRYLYKKSFLDRTGLKYNPAVFGPQDKMFTRTAIILADTVTTVPGAKYNVLEYPTSLSRNARANKKTAETGASIAAWRRHDKFVAEHGAIELFNTPEKTWKTEEFKMFNLPVWRREIMPWKTRCYLFGINIGSKILK